MGAQLPNEAAEAQIVARNAPSPPLRPSHLPYPAQLTFEPRYAFAKHGCGAGDRGVMRATAAPSR